jgi:hypothetical protein
VTGKLTQNGLFENAAKQARNLERPPEVVAVYEKIHAGIWAFNGFFLLTDAWTESDGGASRFDRWSKATGIKRTDPQSCDFFGGEIAGLAKGQGPVRIVRLEDQSAL